MFVKQMEITQVLPCIADSMKIRGIAKADRPLKEALPYLNQVILPAFYSKDGEFLTYKRGLSIITLHASGEIAMTQIKEGEWTWQNLLL